MQSRRSGKIVIRLHVLCRRTSDWQMSRRINLERAHSTIHLRRAVNLCSRAILYILHAINIYRSDLNCEITCSWEAIKIYVLTPFCNHLLFSNSALLDTAKWDKMKWKMSTVRECRNHFTILFWNSQRLRSTKVATSTNNVKLTISKLNAVTDGAFAATRWQRFRRETGISNAKVRLNNNKILHHIMFVGESIILLLFRHDLHSTEIERGKPVQSGFSIFEHSGTETIFYSGFVSAFIRCFTQLCMSHANPGATSIQLWLEYWWAWPLCSS